MNWDRITGLVQDSRIGTGFSFRSDEKKGIWTDLSRIEGNLEIITNQKLLNQFN